ncbi:hypothetical protein SAY87_001632 [Trapa incisa]|uniref:HTH myb-type domain-containing protein n=1 Tax=Trapa incisa TaxID=236973 RepID=A0AAN7PTR7_9MYRT|nr:hypothetical protein SAY87_001632 [Trapa incisa]
MIEIMECSQDMKSYMEALEEERRKIQVFHRELPLCLFLVTQAIEECKHQLSETTTATTAMDGMNGQTSECSEEQNSMKGPVLEEFIPIKRASSSANHSDPKHAEDDDDVDEQYSHSNGDHIDDTKKSNWLKSVQLWNPNPEPGFHHERSPVTRRGLLLEEKANSGGSRPFPFSVKAADKCTQSSGETSSPPPPTGASTSSSMEGGGGACPREDRQNPSVAQRKQRRCWSADLHGRFVHALQHLGGAHVATPKQIRELMKVDNLTNDEVKSHLQKYRLHAKSSPDQIRGNVQSSQFVVVGSLWAPTSQPPYTAVAEATTTRPGTARAAYARIAAVPHLSTEGAIEVQATIRRPQKKRRGSSSEECETHGSSNSNSGTTWSSGHGPDC